METMLATNELAKTYYDSYHDYPDILCGSTLTADSTYASSSSINSESEDKGFRCTVGDFWFADPFCKSVVTDPSFECYPKDNW
jgi:hypothetical protein